MSNPVPAPYDFNSDQVFSAVRQTLTVVGALLLATLPADLMLLILGLVPMAASVIWSIWRNADNWQDMLFSAMRQAVLIVGALAVGRGWITDQMFQLMSGTIVAFMSSALSFWFYRNAPGPILPGTTIVDPE